MKNRVLSEKNEFYLPKEEFLTVLHFALQYPNWVRELQQEPDTSKAITYDEERVQTSGGYDACSETAMRRYMLEKKKKLVEDTVREVAPEIYDYLLLGVAYGWTFWQLQEKGMPCGKDMYYRKRRQFYFCLSSEMNNVINLH